MITILSTKGRKSYEYAIGDVVVKAIKQIRKEPTTIWLADVNGAELGLVKTGADSMVINAIMRSYEVTDGDFTMQFIKQCL